ncbi:type 2 periplasmic-binding domain-containing protein [Stieleria varia]|uniref:Trm112p-like protein n=1 Tax=Stieleria varia TaxID=2528005 RepID=A0A5C6ATW7_9BACT|nr:Trm112 family protein [Stieleria varia]TWU02506.1 hypothetical protein Pla52n_35560 [Stieleria varia]
MIDPKLIGMLQCPIDSIELRLAEPSLIAELNTAIENGTLRDASDQKVTQQLDEGLVTVDGRRVYPVRGDIPTLTADQAIELPR